MCSEEGNLLDVWNAVMTGSPPVRHVTAEEVMASADRVLPKDNAWRSYVRERYGI